MFNFYAQDVVWRGNLILLDQGRGVSTPHVWVKWDHPLQKGGQFQIFLPKFAEQMRSLIEVFEKIALQVRIFNPFLYRGDKSTPPPSSFLRF